MITILFAIFLAVSAQAQIVMESQYGNVLAPDEFTIVHLKNSGDKIVKVERFSSTDVKVFMWNINYSFWKQIDLSPFIEDNVNVETQYTSESLFSTDGKVCLLLYCNAGNIITTKIINEDGQLIFSATGYAPQYSTSPVIYNTSAGTKMRLIASDGNGDARIYGLPGILITGFSRTATGDTDEGSFNSFPNPTSIGTVTLKYEMPKGENIGRIMLFNMSGQALKTYNIDRSSASMQISTADIPAGNYLWQFCSGTYQTNRKMIVVK